MESPASRNKSTDVYRISSRALQAIPNIGERMADDLIRLGFDRPEQLEGETGRDLYDRLCSLDGLRHDPCVLDTFEAAVHFVRTGERLPWWHFSRLRLGR